MEREFSFLTTIPIWIYTISIEIVNKSKRLGMENDKREVYEQVNSYFVEQDLEQNNLQTVKELLGEKESLISDIELLGYIAEIDYLTNQWADEYERQIFSTTLKELLGTK